VEEIIKEVAESTLLGYPECHPGRIDLFRGMLYFFLQKAGFEVASVEIMSKRGTSEHPLFYLRLWNGNDVAGLFECGVAYGSGVSVRKVTKLDAVGLVVPITLSPGEGPFVVVAACPRNRACEWTPSLQALSYDVDRTEIAEWGDSGEWVARDATKFETLKDAESVVFLLLEERWSHIPPLAMKILVIPLNSLEGAMRDWAAIYCAYRAEHTDRTQG
jgi:hypothetical protein